jgi:hypothetical protein
MRLDTWKRKYTGLITNACISQPNPWNSRAAEIFTRICLGKQDLDRLRIVDALGAFGADGNNVLGIQWQFVLPL